MMLDRTKRMLTLDEMNREKARLKKEYENYFMYDEFEYSSKKKTLKERVVAYLKNENDGLNNS